MDTLDKNICINCGLCCDGTLFKFAKIKEDEMIDPIVAANISYSDDGKKRLRQRCCFLKGKICSIYDKRPLVCAGFKCKQLESFVSNNISYDEAMKTINETIVLKESIERNLLIEFPEITADSLYEKMEIFENYYLALEEPLGFRKKYSRLILDITNLRLITKKYFYSKKPDHML